MEYIERETLMAALCKEIIGDGDYYNGKYDMQDEIRDMVSHFQAADVAPVRHGRWITKQEKDTFAGYLYSYECSECGRVEKSKEPYCHCGAKMDGGKTDA